MSDKRNIGAILSLIGLWLWALIGTFLHLLIMLILYDINPFLCLINLFILFVIIVVSIRTDKLKTKIGKYGQGVGYSLLLIVAIAIIVLLIMFPIQVLVFSIPFVFVGIVQAIGNYLHNRFPDRFDERCADRFIFYLSRFFRMK